MPVKLDPNAVVPDSARSQRIGTKALVPVTAAGVVEVASPISVDTSGKPPGASSRLRDYVPSPQKRQAILQAKGVKTKDLRPERKVHKRGVTRHVGEDYLDAETSAKRLEEQNTAIKTRAKEIFAGQADDRRRWKKAKEIVAEATESELNNPGKRLQKALSILDNKKPLTKGECIEVATKQIRKGALS